MMINNLTALAAVFFCLVLHACASVRSENSDNCQNVEDKQKRVDCFSVGIRSKIYRQVSFVMRENLVVPKSVQDQYPLNFGDAQKPLYLIDGNMQVKIAINADGMVDNVNIMESSGATSFDTIIAQVITNAAPYSLPANDDEKSLFKNYHYELKFVAP